MVFLVMDGYRQLKKKKMEIYKIGVIGYGNVGRSLGRSWQKAGYDVTFGVRDAESPKVITF